MLINLNKGCALGRGGGVLGKVWVGVLCWCLGTPTLSRTKNALENLLPHLRRGVKRMFLFLKFLHNTTSTIYFRMFQNCSLQLTANCNALIEKQLNKAEYM